VNTIAPPAIEWIRRARRLVWRINAGWWLVGFVPLAALLGVLAALALLVLRPWQLPTWPVAAVGALGLLVAAGGAWRRGRRHFVDLPAALARLDEALGLHNRLVSAHAGVGPWPPAPAHLPRPPAWNLVRVAGPPLGALALLVLALRLPLGEADPPAAPRDIHEPSAWAALEELTEQLREEAVVEPPALDALREQVEALREQPAQQWYRQSSLEATDHLREKTGQSLRALEQSLHQAAAALATAAAQQENLSAAQQAALQERLGQALDALSGGALPLNRETLDALRQIDLSQLRQLSAEELAALEKRLREQGTCAGACASQCEGPGGVPGEGESEALVAVPRPGSGGVSRGPGDAPLTLRDAAAPMPPSVLTPISNPNLDRAALGDALGTVDQKPEVDPAAYTGPTRAGALGHAAGGGEAVWRDTATPAEQRALRQYFD
jgi:hypothetical protein